MAMTTGMATDGWWPADEAAAAGYAVDDIVDGPPDDLIDDPVPAPVRTHPARLALGLAILAAERVRDTARPEPEPNPPPNLGLMVTVGLLQETAGRARRALDRRVRAASRTVDWAAGLPGANLPRRSLERSRRAVDRVLAEARDRGEAAVSQSRADATAFVQATVADGVAWAQAQVVPQIVDGLVPHLVDSVLPRIIDGAMPEIRSRVMPEIIDDLTNDPKVRDLAMEQGRGAVGEAAEHLRSTTATADDRVEAAFRRLVHGSTVDDARDHESAPPASTG
jgi:hypothetical protein